MRFNIGRIAARIFVFVSVLASALMASSSGIAAQGAYDLKIAAKNGSVLGSTTVATLGHYPSLNDSGKVAFSEVGTGGTHRTFLIDPSNSSIVSNCSVPSYQSIGEYVQVNNTNQLIFKSYTNDGFFSFITRWDNSVCSGPIFGIGDLFGNTYSSPYTLVLDWVTLNNNGRGVLSADYNNTTQLATRDNGTTPFTSANTSVWLSGYPNFYPMVSDNNFTLLQDAGGSTAPLILYYYNSATQKYLTSYYTIANSSMGFTALGSKPGISDDGELITFMGNKTNSGLGIFATAGFLPVKVAGISGDGRLDPGEIHNDINNNSQVDVGEDAGFFTNFTLSARVGNNKSDNGATLNYTTAYIAWDLNGVMGLYTNQIDLTVQSALVISPPKLVVKVGDTIAGLSGTVNNITVYDPINNNGQLAFWVSTSGGNQAVIRATPLDGSLNLEPLADKNNQGASCLGALSSSRNSCEAHTANPVQIRNGNLFKAETDMDIPAVGPDLVLTRYYNAEVISEVTGWMPRQDSGTWVIKNGAYSGQAGEALSDQVWKDFTLDLDMKTDTAGTQNTETARVNFRYFNENTRYYFAINKDGSAVLARRHNHATADPSDIIASSAPGSLNPLNNNHVKITVVGNSLKVYLNNSSTPLLQAADLTNPILGSGRIALEANNSMVHFDNVNITQSSNNRSYDFNSDDNQFIFGQGWSHSYSLRIKEYTDHVTLFRENGAKEKYMSIGGGNYQSSPSESYDTLTKDATGFTLLSKFKVKYRFDLSGNLTYIQDQNGNKTTLTYTNVQGQMKLSQIASDATRKIIFGYGTNGYVEFSQDMLSSQVQYVYNGDDLIQVVDREYYNTNYAYDPLTHNMITYTDKENNSRHYTYGINDRVASEEDPYGNVTHFSYDSNSTTIINDKGEQFIYTFDTDGLLVSLEDPDGYTENFLNLNGNRTDYYDKNNNHTHYNYNTAGDLVSVIQYLPAQGVNYTQSFVYHPTYHSVTSHTNARGFTTGYTYDNANGNLLAVTDALGRQKGFTYDSKGQMLTFRDERGNTTSYQYNGEGDVARKILPAFRQYDYQYDYNGYLTQVTNPLQFVTTYTYDYNQKLRTVTDPLLRFTEMLYYPSGYLAQVIDPLFNTITYTYDAFGNILTTSDANGGQVVHTNDLDNQMHLGAVNLTNIADQNGNPTNFNYDPLNRLKDSKDAASAKVYFTYDGQGNLILRKDAQSNQTSYAYDEANRLTGINYLTTSTPDTSFVLDANGNKTSITDVLGTTLLTYDALDRVTQVVRPNGWTVSYEYDKAGNRTKVLYPSGVEIRYDYSENNEVTAVYRNNRRLTVYVYDDLGRMKQKSLYAAGPTQSIHSRMLYTYDAANQLLRIERTQFWPPVSTLVLFDYTYDQAGNRISVAGINGNFTYGYDYLNQLTSVGGYSVHSFGYDSAGNRSVVDGGNYITNNLNQYMAIGPVNYTYDADGNMTSAGARTFGYDQENRLTNVNDVGLTANYVYDGLGRRVKKIVNGVMTQYVYDGDRVIAEYDAGGTFQAEYIYGVGIDEVLAMRRAGIFYHYIYDGLGTVARLVNDAGVTLETYQYDAYGEPRQASLLGNPYMFTGREYDSETGLYNYRARMYDSRIGRFLQRDPIGFADNINLYSYVKNNPTNWVDPWGLQLSFPSMSAPVMLPPLVMPLIELPELMLPSLELSNVLSQFDASGMCLLSKGKKGVVEENKEGTTEIKERISKGKDGSKSQVRIEIDKDGRKIEVWHEVKDKDGNIIHRDWKGPGPNPPKRPRVR